MTQGNNLFPPSENARHSDTKKLLKEVEDFLQSGIFLVMDKETISERLWEIFHHLSHPVEVLIAYTLWKKHKCVVSQEELDECTTRVLAGYIKQVGVTAGDWSLEDSLDENEDLLEDLIEQTVQRMIKYKALNCLEQSR